MLKPKYNILPLPIDQPDEPTIEQTSQSAGSSMQLRKFAQNSRTHKMEPVKGRQDNTLIVPLVKKAAGDATFGFFFAKFINQTLCVKDIHQRFSFFKTIIYNNINVIFLEVVKIFENFNVKNKNFDYLLKKNCIIF